jgi:2-oxoglutarate ferredoxin oxidoreductase subunit alpha
LWPFPEKQLDALVPQMKDIISVELSAGQMVEDIRLIVNGRKPVYFYGRMGGMVPNPEEIVDNLEKVIKR